ncbi:MAG: hypothetical protein GC191_15240 [Azospirillum sp.]|nr:hypothetical protein [Azospirillum sp.]
MTEVVRFSDEDYRQLLKSVARTPRGRAFLKEHAHRARIMASDEVYRLVAGLRATWEQQSQNVEAARHVDVLRRELQDMSASIAHARAEISSLRPPESGSDKISVATNELDAIVSATERASFEILNAAERILELTARLREAGAPKDICSDLDAEATALFTACSFQDLTGQRTTKVVNALRYVEQRVTAMIGIWGAEAMAGTKPVQSPADLRPDAHLLNGPSADGIDQSEIDRLLDSDFDPPAPAEPAAPSTTARKPAPSPEPTSAPLDQMDIDALFG